MRTSRDRRERTPVDLYPEEPACPACQHALKERDHQQRWIIRLDQQGQVVSHVLECGHTACARRALIDRPHQEDAWARRGDPFGLDVVARMGERRYRDNLSITKLRGQLESESTLALSLTEVALLGAVVLALVTTGARQDQALIEQGSTVGRMVLASAGGQPENSDETLDMLRDVGSGRVFVAQTLLSSATSEIEPVIEDVRAGGGPSVGVIRDPPESSCGAVQRQGPTGPHQICQDHELKAVAPPVGAAARQFKRALQKKVRGISDVERQAEPSLPKAAQVVADYCRAIRPVMRAAGKSPLEPPGLQLEQQLPRMAASVERVRAAQPSALLKKLSRMLAVWHVFPKAFEPGVRLFSWIHQIAHLVQTQTPWEAAQSQLLACVQELQQSGLPTARLRVGTSVAKITVALAPHLFDDLKHPLLPRTTNDLELFIGRIKKSRRHITGRKNTPACMLREGSFVALLFGLPHPNHWVDAFSKVNRNDFHDTLHRLRQTEKRRKCWHTRRDLGAYLSALEQPGVPHEGVLQR